MYNRLLKAEDTHLVQLNDDDIWVQIYDTRKGFTSENIMKNIGDYIKKFVKSDHANYDGRWKWFVRIRVKKCIKTTEKKNENQKRRG